MRSAWTEDEVQVLLALWADERVQDQLTSAVRNEKVFSRLSADLASVGIHRTANQCRSKIKKMKENFKRFREQGDFKHRDSLWFTVMEAVLGQQGPEPEEGPEDMETTAATPPESPHQDIPQKAPGLVTGTGGRLTFSALSLLVPPLRLMSAFAWEVIRCRNVMHYGKVEELVRLVMEIVPDLLDPRERDQLILGLKAKLVLDMCGKGRSADPVLIQTHLEAILSLKCSSNADQQIQNSKSTFVEMVQNLLTNPDERKTFFQEVYPVHYGPGFDAALQTLVWEFVSRLDQLLPIPDITQTAEWLSAAPSGLEECRQLALQADQLETLLHCCPQQGIWKKDVPVDTGDTILSVLSLPAKPTPRKVAEEHTTLHHNPPGQHTSYGTGPQPNKDVKDEELSDQSREEEESAEEKLSDEEWIPEKDQKASPTSGFRHLPSARQHTCSLCPFSHNQVSSLLQHIRTEHLATDPSSEEPNADRLSQQLRTQSSIAKRRLHTCGLCGKVFKKLCTLNRHAKTHTLPYQCDQCEKRYSCKGLLTKHQRIHTGDRPYKCPHCDRGFMCSDTLKTHVRTHTGERPYKCHICGKTSIQHLARHMLMHQGQRNYLCTVCGKAFLSSGELSLHSRYHTGERPHVCKQCGRDFIAKCHLTVHMRTHTGERPYHCTLCPKAFPTSNLLKRHMFIHYDKKPHQCFRCGKGFTQSHAMKLHIRTRKCTWKENR